VRATFSWPYLHFVLMHGFASAVLIRDFIDLMRLSEPSSIIGTQTIALQHFSDILPDLASTFDAAELSEIVISFSDAAPLGHGKTVVWKLLLHLQTARSIAFDDASARVSLVPSLIRWVKPFLGRRPPDIDAPVSGLDATLIVWVETLRLAVTVLAVMLDKLSEFVVLAARQSRMAMLQEKENIDLVFSCLPK
jgi:dedicator of cytokinesis protein 3